MTLMSDTALEAALKGGGLHIDPAPEEVKAASVDLRLGPEAFLGTSDEIIDLERRRLLIIPPGEMALVSIYEKIRVGPRYAAQIGLRSFFARKGLALLAGPQIDPGFQGRLHVALVNLSPTEISIAHREPLVTAMFHDLGEDVGRPYGEGAGDDYHEQDKITGSEIDDIRQHRGYAMSEVIREMATLSTNVGGLRESVDNYINRSNTMMTVFISTIVALVLGILGALAQYIF